MEIQKFEAYKYKGKDLDSINRTEILEQVFDLFTPDNFLGYEVGGTENNKNEEWIIVHLYKEVNGEQVQKLIKFDFSDVGIEIGTQEWNEELEEEEEFIPEVSFDSNVTTYLKPHKEEAKNINKNLGKYNV